MAYGYMTISLFLSLFLSLSPSPHVCVRVSGKIACSSTSTHFHNLDLITRVLYSAFWLALIQYGFLSSLPPSSSSLSLAMSLSQSIAAAAPSEVWQCVGHSNEPYPRDTINNNNSTQRVLMFLQSLSLYGIYKCNKICVRSVTGVGVQAQGKTARQFFASFRGGRVWLTTPIKRFVAAAAAALGVKNQRHTQAHTHTPGNTHIP